MANLDHSEYIPLLGRVFPIVFHIIYELQKGRSLPKILEKISWGDKISDRSRVLDWVYTALRYHFFSKKVVEHFCKRSPNSRGLSLLLPAIAKIHHSPRMAPIVVNVVVSHAKSKKKYQHYANLVNAVLRGFLIKQKELTQELMAEESIWCDLPNWWIKKLKKQYPNSFLSIINALHQMPPMNIRVNRRIFPDPRSYEKKYLSPASIEASFLGEAAYYIPKPLSQFELPGHDLGYVTVQDFHAQKAEQYLKIFEGARILDTCSAPGGKCAHILETHSSLDYIAVEIDQGRLNYMSSELKRLGLERGVKLICADITLLEKWWDGQFFDRILLDVPCTSSGSVRRHLDSKLNQKESDFPLLLKKQQHMLRVVWPTLQVGGVLLYATCSLFQEENIIQIQKFCHDFSDALIISLDSSRSLQGLTLLPDNISDGFFYCALSKVNCNSI